MADPDTNAEKGAALSEEQLRAKVPRFSRRSLLKGAAGIAVVGAIPLAIHEALDVPPAEGLGPDRALFERLTQVILPVQPDSGWVSPADVPVLDQVDTMLRRLDPDLRADLGKGFRLFNWGAVFLGMHFRPFLSLDDEAALAYCRRWENGNAIQAGLMNAMKSMIYVSYWRNDATWPTVDYAGPVSARNGIPHLGNAPLPIEDQPPPPEGPPESPTPAGPEEEVSHAG